MTRLAHFVVLLCAAAILGAPPLAVAAPAVSAPAAGAAPSDRDLTRAAAIADVTISPDGQHIAALTAADGDTVNISVWKTAAMGEAPINIGATHMRFLSVQFLKSDRLLVTAVQTFTAGNYQGHIAKTYVTDLQGKTFSSLLPINGIAADEDTEFNNKIADPEVFDSLPADPQNVLVLDNREGGEGDIYRVNVYTMAAERIQRGSEKVFGYKADLKGELRARRVEDIDKDGIYIATELRDPATGVWQEHFRSHAKDRNLVDVVGFSTDPNVVYIATTEVGDTPGIYEYDLKQRKILDPLFQHKLFEVEPVVIQSKAKEDFGQVLGFEYQAADPTDYWADPKLDAIDKGLRKALSITSPTVDWVDPASGMNTALPVPSGADIHFVSMSYDRRYIVVEKSGPTQPPEYFLLTDGTKLELLGKARPWINKAALGDTTLVEYRARDGLMIPAFLTLPPKDRFGAGPYPTLIEPHGGPWARDYLDWDLAGWIQYFASRGYAVLQPQFRGSEGWGGKLWRAGDGEWGQKMQDDKDDGVKWMVAQHIADPKRVAMFGYSYGGYAALTAAIRPNGLYQCAISGAGAGDLEAISEATFDNRFQREFQHPTIKGLDALAHAKEAQIPLLIYHGDRDQTVDIEQSRRFAAALKAAGKPYKLVEIPDMGHQYVFMTPAMMQEQLDIIDAFLKTDCKPGGL